MLQALGAMLLGGFLARILWPAQLRLTARQVASVTARAEALRRDLDTYKDHT